MSESIGERKWDDAQWRPLIRSIRKQNCILMLGPDASREKAVRDSLPLTEILSNELYEEIKDGPMVEGHRGRNIDPSNLAQVSHYYDIKNGRDALEAIVEDFYEQRMDMTSRFHSDLAALPFYLTITATPDKMFYNALQNSYTDHTNEILKKPKIEGYNFHGPSPTMVKMGTKDEPLIFQLYGKIEDSYSMVLTENDLLDFLVNIVSGSPGLPKNLHSELQAPNKSFLFLGFGFRYWYLRVLLHVLQGQKKKAHSFALERFPKNQTGFEQTILFYESGDCKIHIYGINDLELNDFARNLREKFEQEGREASLPESQSAISQEQDSAPTVFICHAHENKEFAASLYKELENAGFRPWLDKESLRGGDQWDEIIKKSIKKDIDYVIVLQSRELNRRIEGYVHTEIKMALERHAQFRKMFRFLLPVKINDCEILEELSHLHTIDCTGMNNIDQIIKSIRRDQNLRKEMIGEKAA
jgi:hypothetical protein